MLVNKKTDNQFSVNLMCSNCKTCPNLHIDLDENEVLLEDDHGNTNRWTVENFRELAHQIKEGNFDQYLS